MVGEGYKQTEVGVIPEDWECVEAGTIVSFFGGNGFSSRSETKNGIRWLKIANVGVEQVKWDNVTYLPEEFAVDFKDYLLQPDDVVMALTRPILGDKLKVARLGAKDSPSLLNQRVAKLSPIGKNQSSYIYYLVQRLSFVTAMNIAMAGTDPPNIGNAALAKVLVPVPSSFEEQRSIAQALSDVDALIAALEKAIAKKRAIKTATMQQLLTGKKRLPGFGERKGYQKTEIGVIPEDWEVNSLGELTEYIKGFAFRSSDFQTHGVRVIRVSDTTFDFIKTESEIFIDEKKANIFRKWAMREGDLIISTVGSKPPMYDSMVGKATFVDSKNIGSLLNQNAVIIRSKDWNREAQVFLHNHLKQPRYIDHIEKIFRGNANQASITLKELFEFLIPTPKDREEQHAIATVLSDMDAEIASLETRLAKTQALKQGMMQALLTGRVRLV